MATKKAIAAPADKLAHYERLLASVEGITGKSNFGSAYTAVNGNMYSMISKYGVVGIRLPEPELSAFIAKFNTEIFRADPAWPPSKQMAAVPDDLLSDTDTLRPYLELSFRHAQSLRPKPTTRSPKAATSPKP